MISSRAFDFAPGEQVVAALLPVFGTQRIGGGVIWNNVENFVGSTFPGRPADRAPRYQSTCRQCGAPHEAKAPACGYCLSPMDVSAAPDAGRPSAPPSRRIR